MASVRRGANLYQAHRCTNVNCTNSRDAWDCMGECLQIVEDETYKNTILKKIESLNQYKNLIDVRVKKYDALYNDILLAYSDLQREIEINKRSKENLEPIQIRDKIKVLESQLNDFAEALNQLQNSYVSQYLSDDENWATTLESIIEETRKNPRAYRHNEILSMIDVIDNQKDIQLKIRELNHHCERCTQGNLEYNKVVLEIENLKSRMIEVSTQIPIVYDFNIKRVKNLIEDGVEFQASNIYCSLVFLGEFFKDAEDLAKKTSNSVSPIREPGQETPVDLRKCSSYSEEGEKLIDTYNSINLLIRKIDIKAGGFGTQIYENYLKTLETNIELDEREFKRKYKHSDEYHQLLWNRYEESFSEDRKNKRNEFERKTLSKFLDQYDEDEEDEAYEAYWRDRLVREKKEMGNDSSSPTEAKIFFTISTVFNNKKLTNEEYMLRNHRSMTRQEKMFFAQVRNMENTFRITAQSERRANLEIYDDPTYVFDSNDLSGDHRTDHVEDISDLYDEQHSRIRENVVRTEDERFLIREQRRSESTGAGREKKNSQRSRGGKY